MIHHLEYRRFVAYKRERHAYWLGKARSARVMGNMSKAAHCMSIARVIRRSIRPDNPERFG